MNIIIVGCGKVGATLAERLSNEGHEITIIDKNGSQLKRVTEDCDVMGILGNGAKYDIQEEAGIGHADLFIAVTGSDELNLLCCLIAKKSASGEGCKTIARVRDPDFLSESTFIKERLGISLIINPELETAREITRLLSYPPASEVDTLAKGKVDLITVKIPASSPLDGKEISSVMSKTKGKILICAIERNGEYIIPNGQTVLLGGDKVSFVSTRKECTSFLKKSGIMTSSIRTVLIIGGGKISYYLAKALDEFGYKVKIIEKNRERCEFLNSDLSDNIIIINGDGSDQRLLLEEGVDDVDAFAALTDIDEENIMLGVYVSTNFDAKTVTKINKLNFEGITEKLDIGSVVYPKHTTTDQILSYVRALLNASGSSSVSCLYSILDGKAQAVEFLVTKESIVTGVPLKNLNIKNGILLSCISRQGKVIIPSGNDEIKIGDSVIVVTNKQNLLDLKDIVD